MMAEHIHVKTQCPYCDQVNAHLVDLKRIMDMEIVYCDCDDAPGCGEMYAIRPRITIKAEVYKLTSVKE